MSVYHLYLFHEMMSFLVSMTSVRSHGSSHNVGGWRRFYKVFCLLIGLGSQLLFSNWLMILHHSARSCNKLVLFQENNKIWQNDRYNTWSFIIFLCRSLLEFGKMKLLTKKVKFIIQSYFCKHALISITDFLSI